MSETRLEVRPLLRVFRYGALELEDPDPTFSAEEVKEFWGDVYPELTQAVIEGPDYKDDRAEYTFRRAVGTKGSTGDVDSEGTAVTDMLQMMQDLARIVATEDPGDSPILPPWQELEPL
ncbi:PRTRC system protein C [Syntrophorhabdus aromaticivorans]|uniref:PRTRC system protein C n=1 Tax=Syntrophorhabdus aromaticivorans TaxID=328301 RepID=UPI00041434B3|nr:PRTRC system protein C [Syntrophorhabdus aromaticivorans]